MQQMRYRLQMRMYLIYNVQPARAATAPFGLTALAVREAAAAELPENLLSEVPPPQT